MSTVSEILEGIKYGLPNKVNTSRVNRAVRLISKRLFYHHSSLVKGALSVTVSADASSASLPADFWGMIGWPYINGKTQHLYQLPDLETRLAYTSTSQPIYFDIKGQTIYLYPGTTSEITINGDYWAMPTEITALTDTVPFNELFDEAIVEALASTPPVGERRDPKEMMIMKGLINQAVDEIAPYRDKKAPVRVEDNMALDVYANEDWI